MEEAKVSKTPKAKPEVKGLDEKEALKLYEKISVLCLEKAVSGNRFNKQAELNELLKEYSEYKDGVKAVKEQTISIHSKRIYLNPEIPLPATYAEVISKKVLNKKQYLKG